MIGEPFNFETPTKFDKATITFKVDKSKLGDTKFDNLLILWYDEENQTFKEMETVHNEAASTVSTTTTHFSQYMIVDSEKWFDNWEKSFVELRKMWSGNTSYYKALNTILVVDCSWVMSGIDPISYSIEVGYNGVTEDNISSIRASINSGSNVEYYMKKYGRRKCSRASICENIINNMGGGDRAALIMYADGVYSNTGLTGSYYSLISAVQNVNDNGGSLYLNNAVETALSYVTNDAENMYRIVVITHGNVSWGYDLSSYDYTNVSLNVVNLGGGSVGSYLESIVHSTGGEVYYGYPSSSLTGASGGSVTIPPQFIGEDSDNDGIPDLVELYGLKPNGQPINSNPYSKHSDGDGLEDNEELHFSRAKMTYELDKSQYDGSVFIWSDPCLNDTDWDGYDDKKERELGSNPIVANFYIEKEDYEFVMNGDYCSDGHMIFNNNSLLMKAYVDFGNYIFNGNFSKVELYKKAIIDYMDVALNSKKTMYECQEWINLEKSIYEQYNDTVGLAYKVLESSGKPINITKRDMELIEDFQSKMKENLKIINSSSTNSKNSTERINQANLDYEYLLSQVDAVSKKINLKNMSIKFIDGSFEKLNATMDIIDIITSSIETYNSYITFKSNVYMMEDGIKLLETFTRSENSYVKAAAIQLLDIAKKEYDDAKHAWIEATINVEEKILASEINAIILSLPKYGSYASLFLLVGDWATNIGDTAEQAEYVYADAVITQPLCLEIMNMNKQELKNGISISINYKTAAKKFVYLILLRKKAEEQYIAYSKSYPWYSEWADKKYQKIAQDNIDKLNTILDKYTYEVN